ncbi:MAG: SurA N-terminal domain-containing protein [Gammaproteobacteria bacterium]|nr:SurA N-terminal domain-containing protein [Gammaproteobacteria bacterium]MBU1623638.1 SurA N-terminal domain-containing protein [Gammaproteobacteria bacterium]
MFDFVHERKRVVQVVLALIILPFALWGVDSYQNSGDVGVMATVNGKQIGQAEFEDALMQQRRRMQELAGENFDPALFDRAEIKRSVLEGLATQHLLLEKAKEEGLMVSDEQIAQIIAGVGAFQKDGRFDKQSYEAALRVQGMSPELFEYRVRQDILNRQLTDAYAQNGFAADTTADTLIRLNEQQRVVSVATLGLDVFLKNAVVADADAQQYYEQNPQQFELPERAQVDYVVFSADALADKIDPTEAEVKRYYDEHLNEFSTLEQRQASHILISVATQASDAEKQAAKAKAEQLLADVKAAPSKFAALAKESSQDPGSAANGGDLGMFARGMMVKPFDEAVFSMKVGQVSDLVQTDFGYHIIKVTAVEPSKAQPLKEVSALIEQRLRAQQAADKFAELAERFNDTVYEQSDSLQPAAELVGAKVVSGQWLSRDQQPGDLWTAKVMQAVFSEDAVKNKRNTAAVEVKPNTLLAAHVTSHQPASVRPYEEVASGIRKLLQHQAALQAAEEQGKQTLAALQAGEQRKMVWKTALKLSRSQRSDLDPSLTHQIFLADTGKLPAYVGVVDAKNGYVIARIDAVKDVENIDPAKRERYTQQMRQVTGEALLSAYLANAKSGADITMKAFVDESPN